ncbi:M23 family metallopeptidase [Heliobacterium chlorum]|uniref:M23 family metallopeptidase n=1 Tax=Heliobacterium chlorum TaxID=2698 RepID=A0ABR7T214_HELCL|nr:M23 family metallopeptidase [Heliobacterium chlorum]MBC9783894.1 M23 family metallopeptidase [Heliobacterium chlorum]
MKKFGPPESGEWITNRRRKKPSTATPGTSEEKEKGTSSASHPWSSSQFESGRRWFSKDDSKWGDPSWREPPHEPEPGSMLRRWLWQTVFAVAIFALVWEVFQLEQPWAKTMQAQIRQLATESMNLEPLHQAVTRLGLWTEEAATLPVLAPTDGGVQFGLPVNEPVKGVIVQTFGQQGNEFSPGIRIAATAGSPVMAGIDGKIINSWDENGGTYVQIAASDGSIRLMGPLDKVELKAGQAVESDTIVGRLARNKEDQQAQLYLEVRRGGQSVDPLERNKEKGGGTVEDRPPSGSGYPH